MHRFIIIAILFAASTGTLADYWDGWRAYQREDYATALREWMPKARKGDARAQYHLGVMYNEGQGLPVDKMTAMEWFRKAARGGHTQAQVMLAIGYLEGSGVPRDEKKALKWMRGAAKRGNSSAQLQMALMHENGNCVPTDPDKALKWYKLAATSGSLEAQMVLARSYLEGHGLLPDSMEAFKWAIYATTTGDEEAHTLVKEILADMRPEQMTELNLQAKDLYRQGRYDLAVTSWLYLAHKGVIEAQNELAGAYTSGHGLLRNPSEATKWQAIAEGREPEWKAGAWSPAENSPFPLAGKDGVTEPLLTSKVEPQYPTQQRMARGEGKVVLLAVIKKDGAVGEISILRSSPPQAVWEEAAIEAVSQWRYEPATKDGEPVEALFTVWVSFTIH